MLDKLKITNFQKHKELEIEFDKITTIIGESDRGKSAVIRSLVWAMDNRPKGCSFINWDSNRCEVAISIDGNEIKRSRANKGKENSYFLNGIEYKAFGDKIPEDITNVLNTCDHNFQGQFDPSFWFFLSGGQLSEELNKIVDMSIIDYTFSVLNSEKRNITSEINILSSNKLEFDEKIKKYDGIEEKIEQVELIEDLISKDNNKKDKIKDIDNKVFSIEVMESEISKIEPQLLSLSTILSNNKELDGIAKTSSKLDNCIDTITINNDFEYDFSKYDSFMLDYKTIKNNTLKMNDLNSYFTTIEENSNFICIVSETEFDSFNKLIKSNDLTNKKIDDILKQIDIIDENLIINIDNIEELMSKFNSNNQKLSIKNNLIKKIDSLVETTRLNSYDELSLEVVELENELKSMTFITCPKCGHKFTEEK